MRAEARTPAEIVKSFCLSELEKILQRRSIAAICIEPIVQGAGGMIVHPEGFLREVRAWRRDMMCSDLR